ncbi:MAG: endolytic transglycosylase MltG [bacterium]|nr:endolytic transglycosylase MltG [bacterium]
MIDKFKLIKYLFVGVAVIVIGIFLWNLLPINVSILSPIEIRIEAGMGVNEITDFLYNNKLIRSPLVFKTIAFITSSADKLRPGKYLFQGQLSYWNILKFLIVGGDEEVTIQITEGATIYDIDAELSKNSVLKPGELLSYNKKQSKSLEGYLFPDTYRFYEHSSPEVIVEKMTIVFKEKTEELLTGDETKNYETLILASILEKEVPSFEDRRLVAGILIKRMANNWPLQVDGSICYAKEPSTCYPLSSLDFKINSPYNSYMNKGLPPTPIGNPGIQAIKAAISPKESRYWFYISDPKTSKTIFAKTLEEHVLNKSKYLR